jgi:hypothetical protein
MKIIDYLSATKSKWPHQAMTVKPVSHWDDLEADGSQDFVVTMIVDNKQVAYRVDLETALEVDGWINHALRAAVKKGRPVSVYTAQDEPESEVEAAP